MVVIATVVIVIVIMVMVVIMIAFVAMFRRRPVAAMIRYEYTGG